MPQHYPTFLSAVSNEFGAARDRVANVLRAKGVEVRVQTSFGQVDGTTLGKLHDYIERCRRVIAVIGDTSGAFPPEEAVTDAFRAMLPEGVARASYTQWEVIFARHYRIPTFHFAAQGYPPERAANAGDKPAAQAAWRDWLFRRQGLDRTNFANVDQLEARVLGLDWPTDLRAKPSNLPNSVGQLFKGREDFLAQLRASFAEKPAAAIIGQAVHGLGGIGKTRAAIEYGHAHWDDYAALFFLVGKSESDLHDSLAALSGAAVLDLPEQEVPDLPARMASVVNWLNTHRGWLLIIDNVDEEPAAKAVQAFLAQVSRSDGHVLITSRVSAWGPMVEPLELDLLTVDAAREVLLAGTPHRLALPNEDAALTRLVDTQLGCLSLALVQAAAFIDDRRISFADYAARFEAQAKVLLAKLGPVAMRKLDYPRPVALTWQTSFAQLGPAGKLLLDMLAWLSIEPIPRSLFIVWPQQNEIDLEEGLAELTRLSLAHWEEGNAAITVHRLVQQVTRDNQDVATRDRALDALFPWLFAVNPLMNASDVRCWPLLLPLLPHALALFERTSELAPYQGQPSLLDEYSTVLRSLARFAEAEPLQRRALTIDEANYGPDDPTVAIRLGNLAGLLRDTNRLDEAEALYRRSLAIGEAHNGPDHPNVAIRLNNLGDLLRDTNKLSEAETLFRRALTIDETSYDPHHPRIAIDLNNLAQLLSDTNRLDEAEPLFRRALAIDEASNGHDHPNVAIRLNNLAGLLFVTNRLGEAEPLFRRALAIDEASYGPDHPNVAIRLNNLAQLLSNTKRLDEAEPLCRRALAIDKASYGPDHPGVAIDLSNLATLLYATNRLIEAEPHCRQALVIDEASYGPNHPNVAIRLHNLAQLLRSTDRLGEAEPLLRRAASIYLLASKASGHRLPNLALTLRAYAEMVLAAGRTPEQGSEIIATLMREAGFDPADLWQHIFGDDDKPGDAA